MAGGYKYIFELCCHGCHLGGFERKWNNGLTLDIGGVQPGAFLGLMENLSVIPRVQWVGFSQEPVEVTKAKKKKKDWNYSLLKKIQSNFFRTPCKINCLSLCLLNFGIAEIFVGIKKKREFSIVNFNFLEHPSDEQC